MSTQSVSNWWAENGSINSPTLTRSVSVTRTPSVSSSTAKTPSVSTDLSVSSGPESSILSTAKAPSVSTDLSVSSGPESSILSTAKAPSPVYTGQPKPVWVPDGGETPPGGSEKTNRTLFNIIGGLIFLCLVFMVFYVVYHWLWAKRTHKIAENVAENSQVRTDTRNQVLSEVDQNAKTCPEKSPYGDQFPVGSGDCQDSDPNCPAWASNDECLIDPGFMLYKCQKSCKTCGLDKNTIDKIRDSNLRRCQDWGDCSNAQCTNWYHALRCRKTCFSAGCSM